MTRATLDGVLTVAPDELVAQRHRAVAAFLAERDLEPSWLAGVMEGQVGGGLLLLTSSPVHGLANATSDLDFIRVQDDPIAGPRISTKIFERGHHLEVVSFSEREVQRNLDELEDLAGRPPTEVVAGFRSWDKRFEPRKKQTERIVNGITLDGEAPFLASLPALSVVWSRASLQTAIEQVAHMCLAEAAGELRGRVGYAVNALLHLMDALLSVHGDVYTTRKWYVLRWKRFVDRDAWHTQAHREASVALERLRIALAPALVRPELRLAGDYIALASAVAAATGAAHRLAIAIELAPGAERHPYLPGSDLLVAEGRGLVLSHRELPADAMALEDLASIEPATATTLLRAVRAGLARVTVAYGEEAA